MVKVISLPHDIVRGETTMEVLNFDFKNKWNRNIIV